MTKKSKLKKNNKRYKLLIIVSVLLILMILIFCYLKNILFQNNEPTTKDYGYTINMNVEGIAFGNFYDGLALVINSEGKIGFMNKSGNIVIGFQYDYALNFNDGMTCVNKFGQDKEKLSTITFAIIDANGKNITGWAKGMCASSKEGLFAIRDTTNGWDEEKYFAVDKTGKKQETDIFNQDEIKNNTEKYPEYSKVGEFSNGLAYAETLSEAGFIRENGEWAFQIDGYAVGNFHNNRAVLAKTESANYQRYVVDKEGNTVFELSKYNQECDLSSYQDLNFLLYNSLQHQYGREYHEGLLLICNYENGHNNFYLLDDQGYTIFALKSNQ